MPTSEADILRAILLESSRLGVTLFRNQVGRYQLADGRWLSSGLCVGSPDLVGWTPLTITPEHVGRRLAVFTGVEVKTDRGQVRPEQRAFLAALERDGAVAGVARSVADLVAMLKR